MNGHNPVAGKQQMSLDEQAANVAELQNLKSGRPTHGQATASKLTRPQGESEPSKAEESDSSSGQEPKKMTLGDLAGKPAQGPSESSEDQTPSAPEADQPVVVESAKKGGASLAASAAAGMGGGK